MQYTEHVSSFLYVISTCCRHSYLLLSHMHHNHEQGQCGQIMVIVRWYDDSVSDYLVDSTCGLNLLLMK